MKIIATDVKQIKTGKSYINIRYTLWVSQDADGIIRYAISVTDLRTNEMVSVKDLTTDQKAAKRFYHKLIQGDVTPVSLKDLAEDFVGAF